MKHGNRMIDLSLLPERGFIGSFILAKVLGYSANTNYSYALLARTKIFKDLNIPEFKVGDWIKFDAAEVRKCIELKYPNIELKEPKKPVEKKINPQKFINLLPYKGFISATAIRRIFGRNLAQDFPRPIEFNNRKLWKAREVLEYIRGQ